MFDHSAFASHEGVHAFHDAETGLRLVIAVHSTALGPAAGGCRMWDYADGNAMVTDALRLSQGMSYKNAMADLPLGGGKAVIWGNPRTDKTPDMFKAFGRAIESLNGQYWTAEDVGLTPADLAFARQETAYVAGLDQGDAASGDPSPVTAEGVFRGIGIALKHATGSDDYSGRSVAVQGLGHVGGDVVRKLRHAGAKVFIADIHSDVVEQIADETGAEPVSVDDILFLDVDALSPNALGAIINPDTVNRLNCKVVAGGANNQLATPQLGEVLRMREITYAPDYVINGGGIINVAAEISGNYSRDWVLGKLDQLMTTLDVVLGRAKQEGRPSNEVADELAEARILAAKQAR